jgi:hypothetical protein
MATELQERYQQKINGPISKSDVQLQFLQDVQVLTELMGQNRTGSLETFVNKTILGRLKALSVFPDVPATAVSAFTQLLVEEKSEVSSDDLGLDFTIVIEELGRVTPFNVENWLNPFQNLRIFLERESSVMRQEVKDVANILVYAELSRNLSDSISQLSTEFEELTLSVTKLEKRLEVEEEQELKKILAEIREEQAALERREEEQARLEELWRLGNVTTTTTTTPAPTSPPVPTTTVEPFTTRNYAFISIRRKRSVSLVVCDLQPFQPFLA